MNCLGGEAHRPRDIHHLTMVAVNIRKGVIIAGDLRQGQGHDLDLEIDLQRGEDDTGVGNVVVAEVEATVQTRMIVGAVVGKLYIKKNKFRYKRFSYLT